ncbi:MAG: response regulator transcription factor [Acidobacteriota bacterium]
MVRGTHGNKHPLVCLLSSHPLLLEEFSRKLSKSHFPAKVFRLRHVFFEDVNRMAIPAAGVYVVDGHDPSAAVLVGALVNRFPNSHVIVLSEKFNDTNAFPFLELGAKGLLDYSEAAHRLPEAVKAVAEGEFWVDRNLLSRFMGSIVHGARRRFAKAGRRRLSPREREVLECLLENFSNKEIAKKLNISERTAKFHVSNLLAKFDVRRRVDLIMLQLHE